MFTLVEISGFDYDVIIAFAAINCEKLAPIPNARIEGDFRFGSVVTVTCSRGYRLRNQQVTRHQMSCDVDGRWLDDDVTKLDCQRKYKIWL